METHLLKKNMGKKENNILYRRLLRSYFSSIISISLVLFFVGMAGLVIVNARSVSDYFKENITVNAILALEADETDAEGMIPAFIGSRYIKDTKIISKEEGVIQMKELLGEDFLDLFEVNPIPVSIELKVDADYISTDSLKVVEEWIRTLPDVEDVVYQQSLVDLLNANIERVALISGGFVLLLLFISVVLISNTVRLNVYSKRFTIHTMRLVGATKSFITKPFVGQAFFQGFISGAIADLFLLLFLHFVKNEFYQLFTIFDAMMLGTVMGVVILFGILICMISTAVVVRNMISLNNDQLYY